jgi:hypothetical protein
MGVDTFLAQLRTLSHSVEYITIFDRGRSQQATIDESHELMGCGGGTSLTHVFVEPGA